MKVKNIMFSGVMAAILGATGANAAINVASQGYVDSKVGAVESNITNNYLSKTDADEKFMIMQDAAALGANLQWTADGKLDTKGIATAEGLDRLDERVKGNASTEGSIAYDIAAALGEAKSYADTAEADAVATAKEYSDSLAENYDAAGSAAAVEAKLADYTKTSELNATFATDEELGVVDAKFANYTTTEALNTKLNDYAKQVDLEAEVTARDTAVKAVDAKLADYTKTADLDKGFVSESEMTEFKTANTAAINAKVAQSDYDTTVAALNAKDTELADDISQLESDLTSKITMPEVCATTNCVLSTLGGTVQWVPLTEPLDSTASN